MTKPRVTIIGLGLIGGSIGLGLRASAKAIQVVGHDKDPGRNKLAKKMGAVDDSSMNLFDACQGADLVIIATPVTAIRETLELIGPELKQGCVITDTATLKEPVLSWAKETLPASISFVGGDPLLNPNAQATDLTTAPGLESAQADLLRGALYALCAPPETSPTAVKRVADMIQLLQARPFFVDPIEHDGMRAAVEGLPALTSLALMQQVGGAPGWQETRKLADHVFGMATASLSGDAAIQRAHILLNVDHLIPRLDALIHELGRLREWVATRNAAALEDAFSEAASVRTRWLIDRASGEWEEELGEIEILGTMGALGNMFGLGSLRREPKEE